MLALANVPPDPTDLDDARLGERLDATRPWHHAWAQHPTRDPYWANRSRIREDITVPTLFFSGWRDTQLAGTWRDFAAASADAAIVCGPWTHGMPEEQPVEPIDSVGMAIEWFDHHLHRGTRDTDSATAASANFRAAWMPSGSRILNYVMSGGVWETPELTHGVSTLQLRITEDLKLQPARVTQGPGAASTPERGTPSGADVAVPFDPSVGTTSGLGMTAAPEDQTPDLDRSVVWSTAPLEQPLDIYGEPALNLVAELAGSGADIGVKLCEVTPDGMAHLITRGYHRAHRSGNASPDGRQQQLSVLLDPIRYRVSKGNRLQLALAAAEFPEYWPNPDADGYQLLTSSHEQVLHLPLCETPHPILDPTRIPTAPAQPTNRQMRNDSDGYLVRPTSGSGIEITAGDSSEGATIRGARMIMTHRLQITGTDAPSDVELRTETHIEIGSGSGKRTATAHCIATRKRMLATLEVARGDFHRSHKYEVIPDGGI